MTVMITGLLLAFLAYALLVGACLVILVLLPATLLGAPVKAIVAWLPPFAGGDALRNWAASAAERLAKTKLAGRRTAKTGVRLATELEEGAMRAMLPEAASSDLDRIIACPEAGQGKIRITAPEAINLAAWLRKNRPHAEVQRVHQMAAENVRKTALQLQGQADSGPLPCPLQGTDHVCCAYSVRPLQCRPMHAIRISRDLSAANARTGAKSDESGHEQTVAQGIEMGLARALKSEGLDSLSYELNWALATALEKPDAAERWARGENVFYTRKA